MAEDRLEAVTDLAMVADRAEEAMVEDMVAAVALVEERAEEATM